MDPEKQKLLYEELGRSWRHFASWREKIFGGYLAVLAALGVAYSHDSHPSDGVVIAILVGAIVFSIVFWIFDVRSNQLVNACQNRAALLELEDPGGTYRAITSVRDDWLTYSLAVDVLVSSVVTGAAAYILRVAEGLRIGFRAFAFMPILGVVLQWQRRLRKPKRCTSQEKSAKSSEKT